MTNTLPSGFWKQIDHQLERIRTEKPRTFAAVRAILLDPAYDSIVKDRDLNGARAFAAGAAFFAGSGGDATLYGALREAGWRMTWSEASYYYVAQHASGSILTYVEGDVYDDDQHIEEA